MIQKGYKVNFMIDNLPVIEIIDDQEVDIGFSLGYEENKKLYINNHIRFYIDYISNDDGETYKIVGFYVEPMR